MNAKPTARSLMLGMIIAEAMRRKGWNSNALCESLRWSPTKVSRMKNGDRRFSDRDIAMALAVLGVTGDDQDELLHVAAALNEDNWWLPARIRATTRVRFLHHLQVAATSVTSYVPNIVPSQLQSRDYLSLLANDDDLGESVECAAWRLETPLQLVSTAPKLRLFIHERALSLLFNLAVAGAWPG